MGDGSSKGASKVGAYVLGPMGQSLMGDRNSATMESFESSGVGFAWGRRMKVDVHKTRATSQRSGSTSRRSKGFICQHRDVETNVVTFQKGYTATS